jgi:ATP-binding cassette subfamily B protein
VRDSLGFGLTSALTGYLDLGAGVLILWYGGILVLDGNTNNMTIGKLITFQLYWNMMNSSYQALQGLFTSFTRSAAAAEKVFNLMDSVADIGGGDDDTPLDGDDSRSGSSGGGDLVGSAAAERRRRAVAVDWEVEGTFELRDVDFHYQMRPDNKVLRGMNLKIPGGSVWALVGRSGGGKSTIISMLMRFYDPRGGSIKVRVCVGVFEKEREGERTSK